MPLARSHLIINGHRALDLLLTTVAFAGSYFIKKYFGVGTYSGLSQDPNYQTILFLTLIIWYISFNIFGLYASYRNRSVREIILEMVKAILSGFAILNIVLYFLKFPHVSRSMIIIFVILNIFLLGVSKGIVYGILNRYRKSSYNIRNIVVVGSGDGAKTFIDLIRNRYRGDYRVIGCVDQKRERIGQKICEDVEVVCTFDSLRELFTGNTVDEIIFALPLDQIAAVEEYILLAEEMGINIRFLPEWLITPVPFSPMIGSLRIENFLEVPTLTLTATPNREGLLFIKSTLDYLLGGVFFILSLPLFPIIAVCIKISSNGPIFFRQERVGLNGRRFTFNKFRTMAVNAESVQKNLDKLNESDGPVFKMKKDPRIIPVVGPVLRKTGLDELPQLINVLKGEMSIVGPRPPIPSEVEKYDIWQRRRLSMKPGMTCLWQVTRNRNDLTFKDWMDLDLKYIDYWSIYLDFKILAKTFWVVLQCNGR